MVENKSKTSLIRHIQKKYITHEDLQYNTRAMHSYNIVIFICDMLFLYMSFMTFSYYTLSIGHTYSNYKTELITVSLYIYQRQYIVK